MTFRCCLIARGLLVTALACSAIAHAAGPSKSIFAQGSSTIFPPPMATGTAGQSVSIFPSAQNATSIMEKGMLTVGDFTTSAPVAAGVDALKDAAIKDAADLQQALKQARKSGAEGLRALERRLANIDNPKLRDILDDARTKIQGEIDGYDQAAAKAASQGSFLAKLGSALKILDFVSVGAQAAGYLYEGDRTGAAGVVLNDLAKKGSETVGTMATAWVPGGPVFGSWAGTAFYETNIKPEIDSREQALREDNLRRQVLNKPWLVPLKFMDGEGKVRPLDEDEYIDPETSLVKRRSAEEQAAYERAKYVDWRNKATMQKIMEDHAAGKIDDRQLRELQVSYSQRSFANPWVPRGFDTLMTDLDVEAPETPNPSETAQEPQQTNVDAIMAAVQPVAVTAKGSVTHTLPAWKGSPIVTTYEFAFWNLGAVSPAHSKAVLKISTTGEESFAITGSYSGGPNGTLTFQNDGETFTFQVQNGAHVVGEAERAVNHSENETITLTMPISDPTAFDGWPK